MTTKPEAKDKWSSREMIATLVNNSRLAVSMASRRTGSTDKKQQQLVTILELIRIEEHLDDLMDAAYDALVELMINTVACYFHEKL